MADDPVGGIEADGIGFIVLKSVESGKGIKLELVCHVATLT